MKTLNQFIHMKKTGSSPTFNQFIHMKKTKAKNEGSTEHCTKKRKKGKKEKRIRKDTDSD